MTYKFYYVAKGFDLGLPFEIDASSIYEALRELASHFVRSRFSLDFIRTSYYVTNNKGKTSVRFFKPCFDSFLREAISSYSTMSLDEAL